MTIIVFSENGIISSHTAWVIISKEFEEEMSIVNPLTISLEMKAI